MKRITKYRAFRFEEPLSTGQRKRFEDHYVVEEMQRENRPAPEQIIEDIMSVIGG